MIRSLLFAPANRHDLIAKFPRAGADRYVIDLEDGTPAAEREKARAELAPAVANLRAQNIKGEVYVRLNEPGAQCYVDDIEAAIATEIDGVVVPKFESPQQITPVVRVIERCEGARRRPISIMAGIESVKGVVQVEALAAAHPLLTSLYFGAEDFIADIGGGRSPEGTEVLFARSRTVLAAKLAQIVSIDQIVTDFRDDEQCRRDAMLGRNLGYDGKMCLTPRQVLICNEIFAPSAAEVEHAERLIAAYEEAEAKGLGTFDFGGKFVDTPILKKARYVLFLADRYGK
jgi:citrate lyase subunit beta/citryl-CoA lyase